MNLTRRDFIKAAAQGAAMVGGLAAATHSHRSWAAPATASIRRPNFVVILCDDLGYGDLSCFGHPTIRTPNLDKLAGEGVRLTDCYAAAPVCSPSRCGMLTGRTPHRLGIDDWIPQGSPIHLKASEITVATLLKRAGYATCHSGKWHCNGTMDGSQPTPGDHGFDHWFSTQNNAAPTHFNPTNFVRNGKPVGPLEGYSSTLIVNEALEWLKGRRDDAPFCLFVWFHATHERVATAEEFVAMYPNAKNTNQAIYFGNVTQMDDEVGRLLAALDKAGWRDDTLVFFTSDNGPETLLRYPTADHSYGSPGPLRGMKLHLYEGGIREPGIVRWPGHSTPGVVCHEPVKNTDVLPTLCEIAGVKAPTDRAIDGASILPIFAGKRIERKTPLYWQYDVAISDPRVAMRQGDWKILAHENFAKFELYNLTDDLGEKHDLAESEPKRVKEMSETLRGLHEAIRKEAPVWPAPPKKKAKKKAQKLAMRIG